MVIPKIEKVGDHKKIRLIPVRLHNGKGPNGENPEEGTVKSGVGRCLCCGQAIDSEEIKRQARGESEYGTWQDRLYCVVGVRMQPKKDKGFLLHHSRNRTSHILPGMNLRIVA